MKTSSILFYLLIILIGTSLKVIAVGSDSLTIHNLGHASVMLEFDGKVIHIDPRASEANYANLPDADIICITHGHGDHYDLKALNLIKKNSTIMVLTQAVMNLNSYAGESIVMNNGDSLNFLDIAIEAVPAYNIDDGSGTIFHPKGVGNGYIFTFNDLRVYLAGDTHNIPEMATFNVDIAFIPMNQPYTMTAEMAAEAAKTLSPKILYVYHHDQSFVSSLKELLKDEEMGIRIGESTIIEATKADETSSFLPFRQNKMFSVYPNPSSGLLTIIQMSEIADLSIFDLKGRLVFKKSNLETGLNEIDLNMLNNGCYFLEVNSEFAANQRQKFTIIK